LVGRASAGNSTVNGFYFLTILSELPLQTDGKQIFGANLPAFYERVSDEQYSVVIVRRQAFAVMKPKIVRLDEILVFVKNLNLV